MLTFDPATHTYYWQGVQVPSVTQVLGSVLRDYDGIPPHILAAAQERGTFVHEACELDDLGELDQDTLDDTLIPYVMAWRKFRADTRFKPESIEARVYHNGYRYAGTLDRFGDAGAQTWLVDIKSGSMVPRSAGPQTAAYLAALDIDPAWRKKVKRYVAHLYDNGNYQVVPCNGANDFSVFLACLSIHNWRNNK